MEPNLAVVGPRIGISQRLHTELTEDKGGGASRCDGVLVARAGKNGDGLCVSWREHPLKADRFFLKTKADLTPGDKPSNGVRIAG